MRVFGKTIRKHERTALQAAHVCRRLSKLSRLQILDYCPAFFVLEQWTDDALTAWAVAKFMTRIRVTGDIVTQLEGIRGSGRVEA